MVYASSVPLSLDLDYAARGDETLPAYTGSSVDAAVLVCKTGVTR